MASSTLAPPSPHRRVELQAPADFTYLMDNVLRAAREKIDLHLPPGAAPEAGEDEMRRKVEELVQKYIDDVFQGVKLGVSVNGIKGEEVEGLIGDGRPEEFDPYDSRLAARITDLSAKVEALNLQLADLRRTAPQLAAKDFEEKFLAQSQEFDTGISRRDEVGRATGEETGLLDFEDELEARRKEDMRMMYQRGTEALGRLRTGLEETKTKGQRATQVVGYLESR